MSVIEIIAASVFALLTLASVVLVFASLPGVWMLALAAVITQWVWPDVLGWWVVGGALAGALLADMGAEVIKVETPWGELYRYNTPRMSGLESDFPIGPAFQMDNRGKKSIALDPSNENAKRFVREMREELGSN